MDNKWPLNLGFHTDLDAKEGVSLDSLASLSLTYQVFVSNPKSHNQPLLAHVRKVAQMIKAGYRMVVHAPYLVNMCRDRNDSTIFTQKYCFNFYLMMQEYLPAQHWPYLVLHTQHADKQALGRTEENLRKFLDEMHKSFQLFGLPARVSVETDAAQHSPVTRLDSLYEIVHSLGYPEFTLTFDTEHSYASGRHPNLPITKEMWDLISVLHLNGIPPEVELGSGLDRHSETRLTDSKVTDYILPVFTEAIRRNRPVILERYPLDVIRDDITFLCENCTL